MWICYIFSVILLAGTMFWVGTRLFYSAKSLHYLSLITLNTAMYHAWHTCIKSKHWGDEPYACERLHQSCPLTFTSHVLRPIHVHTNTWNCMFNFLRNCPIYSKARAPNAPYLLRSKYFWPVLLIFIYVYLCTHTHTHKHSTLQTQLFCHVFFNCNKTP